MTLRYDTRSRVSTYTQSWVANADPDFGVFESIATTTIGATAQSTITFSSIAGTYKHLQVRGAIRSDAGSNNWDLNIRMNSDTGSNYARHSMRGEGSAYSSEGQSSQTLMWLDRITSGTANVFSGVVIDFLDYANVNKYKTIRGLGGADYNGSGLLSFNSGLWMSSSAVTSLTFTLSSGNFTQYSQLALYGIKA